MNATSWYVARSAGVVAYLLLSSSVVLGLLMAARARFAWPRFAVEEMHRFLTKATGVFIVIHVVALLLDRVVPFGLVQVLVPFSSSYRTFGVGLGVVAVELMAAIGLSNSFRAELGPRLWRRIHYLTIVVWLAATAHVLLVGTDRSDPWFVGLAVGAVGAVAVAFGTRFAPPGPGAAASGRRGPQTSALPEIHARLWPRSRGALERSRSRP